MPTFLIKPADQVVCVVWEEALVVQGVADQLSHGSDAHGLAMVVHVHDMPRLQCLLQRFAVCLTVCRCYHALVRPAGASRSGACSGLFTTDFLDTQGREPSSLD